MLLVPLGIDSLLSPENVLNPVHEELSGLKAEGLGLLHGEGFFHRQTRCHRVGAPRGAVAAVRQQENDGQAGR